MDDNNENESDQKKIYPINWNSGFCSGLGLGLGIGIGLAAGYWYLSSNKKKVAFREKKVSFKEKKVQFSEKEVTKSKGQDDHDVKDNANFNTRGSLNQGRIEDIDERLIDLARQSSVTKERKPAIRLTSTPFRLKSNCKRSGAPLRIIIVRHGESEGNVDESAYQKYGDHGVPLTKDGLAMAKLAGESIANHYKSLYNSPDQAPHIRIWMSPFVRTRQTAKGLLSSNLRKWVTDIRENVNLVELDFGLLEGEGIRKGKELCKNQFARIVNKVEKRGKFYARFPNGESVHDVMGRTSQFLGTLFRDKEYHRTGFNNQESCGISDIILVTHGITGRAMIMQWFCYGPEWYQSSQNLPNASVFYIDATKTYPDFQGQFLFGGFSKGGLQSPVEIDMLNKNIEKAHINEARRQTDILDILSASSKNRKLNRTRTGSIVTASFTHILNRKGENTSPQN